MSNGMPEGMTITTTAGVEKELRTTIEAKDRDIAELVEHIEKLNGIRVDAPEGMMKKLAWWARAFELIAKHKGDS